LPYEKSAIFTDKMLNDTLTPDEFGAWLH